VILNRARYAHKVFGSRPGATLDDNLRRVILKPYQFSCFLPDDANYEKLLRPLNYESAAAWYYCLTAAQEALTASDAADSLTLNSDHYFDDSLQPPPWADPAKQTVRIGRLQFFRLYLPSPAAGAQFLLRTGSDGPTPRNPGAGGNAAASPSPRHKDFPPETSRRAAPELRSSIVGESSGRHRREAVGFRRPGSEGLALRSLGAGGSGSGSLTSHPAPHLSSQRTPRLENRWYQRSRGLSSPYSGFGTRGSGFGNRNSGFGSHGTVSSAVGICAGIEQAHGTRIVPPFDKLRAMSEVEWWLPLLLLRIAFIACGDVRKRGTVFPGVVFPNPESRVPLRLSLRAMSVSRMASPGWTR
jgi:hypothetical protein